MAEPVVSYSYAQFLADMKSRIRTAQLHASLALNRELALLYWQIGRDILDRQERESWDAKVIDRLAADLKRAFPDMIGFGLRRSPLRFRRSEATILPAIPARGAHPQPGSLPGLPHLRLRRQQWRIRCRAPRPAVAHRRGRLSVAERHDIHSGNLHEQLPAGD